MLQKLKEHLWIQRKQSANRAQCICFALKILQVRPSLTCCCRLGVAVHSFTCCCRLAIASLVSSTCRQLAVVVGVDTGKGNNPFFKEGVANLPSYNGSVTSFCILVLLCVCVRDMHPCLTPLGIIFICDCTGAYSALVLLLAPTAPVWRPAVWPTADLQPAACRLVDKVQLHYYRTLINKIMHNSLQDAFAS